ncbi:cytochrome P450 [Haloarchaeobius amylolyticus]|uniref:cytochrome P450 n=1 Tax=Haloarchaeobius amylolyticus TaxID=1198296 RepID=UPI002271EFD4|nr:cytochrome P450 [Haloarchaeobius amylolyticus]
MSQSLPRPPDAGVINAVRFGTDTFRFIEAMQSRFPDIVGIPIPGRAPLVQVTNPDLIHDALSRPEDFPRVPVSGPAALIAEQGLVQSEGQLWRQQRNVMGSAFAGDQVRAYADTVGERVEALCGEWRDRLAGTTTGAGRATAADGASSFETNLHFDMTALTVRVASEILLGEDIGLDRAEQFSEWMQVAGDEFEFGIEAVLPEWVPTRTSPRFREAASGIRELSEELIERRREALAAGETEGPPDMLSMLIRAESNPEVDFPENQIRDEVATFLIAGHETTALSLTYAQSLLAWHPEVRERVRAEAEAVIGDETPTHDHVDDLAYTGRVFTEALRLYPAAWAVFRQAKGDVQLGDYVVPDGSAVVMPQYAVHRDGRYFENPHEFDPDRWLDRKPDTVPAYFPFSSGPHACIGRQFSLTGARLVLARIAQEFDVDVPEDGLDDLRATPTLRPGNGVDATVSVVE